MIPKKIVVVIVCCIVGSMFTEVNADSLTAHWKFDETSGSSASDSSVNNNTGTLYNMNDDDWVAGHLGNALDFDGSNDYVQVPDPYPDPEYKGNQSGTTFEMGTLTNDTTYY